MKTLNHFFAAIIIMLSVFFPITVKAQVDAGADQHINCGQCATLQGTFSNFVNNDSSYTVASIPYSPVCSFDTGIAIIANIDDRWSNVINLPFDFQFYGNNYNQLLVGSNGIVTFNLTDAGGYCPWPFTASCPSSLLPLNSIFAPYEDIDPSIAGSIKYLILGTYPNRKFVVNFYHIPMYSCTSLITTSQLVLYENSNIIEIYIQNKPLCSSWNSGSGLIGIQNSTATVGLCPPGRNTSQWTAQNEAWRFYTCNIAFNNFAWFDENGFTISADTSISVCPDHTSEYILTANCGCYGIFSNIFDTVTIFVDHPTVNLGNDTSLCPGEQLVLNAWNEGYSYQWSDNSTDSVLVVNNPGIYSVTVTDTSNCYGIDNIIIDNGIAIFQDSIYGPNNVCSGNYSIDYSVTTIPYANSFIWSYTGNGANISILGPNSVTIQFDSNATDGTLIVKAVGICGQSPDSLTLDITILQGLTGGIATSSIDTTVCQGSSGIISLSGFVGNILWQKSFDNTNWVNINGASNPIYITPPLTTTTYYRASLTGGCPTVYSTVAEVPILSAPVAQDICYVSFDTTTQKNKVLWNSSTFPVQIDRVYIYNEISLNVWSQIGNVVSTDDSFIDINSHPESQSYSYKIKAIDICNNISELSNPHTTITLLSSYDQLSNTYGFTWSPYVGLSVGNYNIYGITASGYAIIIGSVPGNQFFFNFVNPGTMFVKYFIGFLTPNCGSKTDFLIMSNFVQPIFASVDEFEQLIYSIVPNPTTDNFTVIRNSNNPILVQVFDIKGQLFISKQITTEPIDVQNLSQGIYFVKIGNKNYKLVKQ